MCLKSLPAANEVSLTGCDVVNFHWVAAVADDFGLFKVVVSFRKQRV